jgi:hypothetical protein
MTYVPYPGGTFLIRSGPNAGQMHLFAVVTRMCSAGSHLLLSVASIRDGRHHDPACRIEAGWHDFIDRPSYVVYGDPQQRPAALISNYVDKGAYIPKADLSLPLLERFLIGLTVSDFARPWALRYCQANLPDGLTEQCMAVLRS